MLRVNLSNKNTCASRHIKFNETRRRPALKFNIVPAAVDPRRSIAGASLSALLLLSSGPGSPALADSRPIRGFLDSFLTSPVQVQPGGSMKSTSQSGSGPAAPLLPPAAASDTVAKAGDRAKFQDMSGSGTFDPSDVKGNVGALGKKTKEAGNAVQDTVSRAAGFDPSDVKGNVGAAGNAIKSAASSVNTTVARGTGVDLTDVPSNVDNLAKTAGNKAQDVLASARTEVDAKVAEVKNPISQLCDRIGEGLECSKARMKENLGMRQ